MEKKNVCAGQTRDYLLVTRSSFSCFAHTLNRSGKISPLELIYI